MIARWWSSLDRTGRGVTLGAILAIGLLAWWLIADWHSYWAQYVATNVLPPSGATIAAIVWAKVQIHRKLDDQNRKLDDQHQDMKQHVTERTGR